MPALSHSVYRVFFAILVSSIQAGRATSLAPDFGKAKAAAARIFALVDKEPEIDNMSEEGKKLQVGARQLYWIQGPALSGAGTPSMDLGDKRPEVGGGPKCKCGFKVPTPDNIQLKPNEAAANNRMEKGF